MERTEAEVLDVPQKLYKVADEYGVPHYEMEIGFAVRTMLATEDWQEWKRASALKQRAMTDASACGLTEQSIADISSRTYLRSLT